MRKSHVVIAVAIVACLGLSSWLWISRTPSDDAAPNAKVAVNTPSPPSSEAPADMAAPADTTDKPELSNAPAKDRGTLRGRVIDAVTRQPVRTFVISFTYRRAGQTLTFTPDPLASRTFTTEDGRFEWPGVEPAAWGIRVRAEGYQTFHLSNVQIQAGKATRELEVPLLAGRTLRGRIFDEATGVGIAGAQVAFREWKRDRFDADFRMRDQIKADKDGSFTLDGLPTVRVILSVRAEDHAPQEYAVSAEDEGPVEIALSSGGSISGRVTAADGVTPVAATVEFWDEDRNYGGTAPTKASGEFVHEHLAPGRYRIGAQSGGRMAPAQELVVGRNQRIEGVVLSLAEGSRIRGIVTGLSAAERRKARVSVVVFRVNVESKEVSLDDQGAYLIEGIPSGTGQIVAQSNSRSIQRPIVVSDGADLTVNFDFPPGLRLSGRVTRNGKPVGSIAVMAQVADRLAVSGATETTASGEYSMEGLTAGAYFVSTSLSRRSLRYIELTGDTVLDLEIPDLSITGRVIEGDNGAPVSEAIVQLFPAMGSIPRDSMTGLPVKQPSDPSRNIRSHVETDDFGAFTMTGLLPGDFVIAVYKPGHEMLQHPLAFTASVNDLVFRLHTEEGVKFSARDAVTGKPLEQIMLLQKIGNANGTWLGVKLDEEGVGFLPQALAGSPLMIMGSGNSSNYTPLEFAWEGMSLDLQFSPLPAEPPQ